MTNIHSQVCKISEYQFMVIQQVQTSWAIRYFEFNHELTEFVDQATSLVQLISKGDLVLSNTFALSHLDQFEKKFIQKMFFYMFDKTRFQTSVTPTIVLIKFSENPVTYFEAKNLKTRTTLAYSFNL